MTAATATSTAPARASLGWAALRLQSDEELCELVSEGYEQAFDAIVERYRSALVRYAGNLVGADRAEDVAQQAFEKALEHLRGDERELQIRPWLYKVTHNLSLNVLQLKGSNYEPLDENYDGVPQPPDVLDRSQSVRGVLRQVKDLPERQRSALMLQAVGGLSYEQIADDMHVTPPIVRQLLYRARAALRDTLGAVIPAPALRVWLDGTASDHGRIAEIVAGAGAGGGIVKASAAMLATGVIATGSGVTVSRQQHDSAASGSPSIEQDSGIVGGGRPRSDGTPIVGGSDERGGERGRERERHRGRNRGRSRDDRDRREERLDEREDDGGRRGPGRGDEAEDRSGRGDDGLSGGSGRRGGGSDDSGSGHSGGSGPSGSGGGGSGGGGSGGSGKSGSGGGDGQSGAGEDHGGGDDPDHD